MAERDPYTKAVVTATQLLIHKPYVPARSYDLRNSPGRSVLVGAVLVFLFGASVACTALLLKVA